MLYFSNVLIVNAFHFNFELSLSCIVCQNLISTGLALLILFTLLSEKYYSIRNRKFWGLSLKIAKKQMNAAPMKEKKRNQKFKTKDLDELSLFWTQIWFESEHWLNTAQNIFFFFFAFSLSIFEMFEISSFSTYAERRFTKERLWCLSSARHTTW